MLIYRFDILEKLKSKGISTYSLSKSYGFSPGMVQKLREKNTAISAATIDKLCGLLGCQPGTLLQWVPDQEGGAPDHPAGGAGPDGPDQEK